MNIGKFFGKKKEQDKLDAFQMAASYQPAQPPRQPSRPTTTNVTFEKTTCDTAHRLSTSEGERTVTRWAEVEEALERMLTGEVEFVTLIAGEAPHGIRFVQSCPLPDSDDFTVELNLEEKGSPRSRLVEKDCTGEECIAIFREFYDAGSVPEREKYKPVEF